MRVLLLCPWIRKRKQQGRCHAVPGRFVVGMNDKQIKEVPVTERASPDSCGIFTFGPSIGNLLLCTRLFFHALAPTRVWLPARSACGNVVSRDMALFRPQKAAAPADPPGISSITANSDLGNWTIQHLAGRDASLRIAPHPCDCAAEPRNRFMRRGSARSTTPRATLARATASTCAHPKSGILQLDLFVHPERCPSTGRYPVYRGRASRRKALD